MQYLADYTESTKRNVLPIQFYDVHTITMHSNYIKSP